MNSEFDPFVAEWKSYVTNPKLNLIEKCLKLAQILEYSNLSIEKEVEKISNLSISLKNCITESILVFFRPWRYTSVYSILSLLGQFYAI